MDPNATTNLDPKLKDMYNRVMSTPVPPPQTPPPAPSIPAPAMPTQPEIPTPTAPPPPTPQPPPTPIQSEPTTEMHAAIPLPAAPKPVSAAIIGGATKSKKMGIFPVIIALAGIIFLGVYTVFWVKFFNLSVPFLPF